MWSDLEEKPPWVSLDPEKLYREVVYGRHGPGSAWVEETFVVVARPGESPSAPPEAGDVLVRVALGEPGLGLVAVLAESTLTPQEDLDAAVVSSEREGPGLYVVVIEGGVQPRPRSDRFARRVLDRAGRTPLGQILLRSRLTPGKRKKPTELNQEDIESSEEWSPDGESAGGATSTLSEQAVPPPATLVASDSTLVQPQDVKPAALCGVDLTPNGTPRVRAIADISRVVVHVLQSIYAQSIATWQAGNPPRGCLPPHYLISRAGEITQMVAESHIAHHARAENPRSIGIEHDGWTMSPSFYTEAMYLASASLVRDVCRRNGLPVDRTHIIGHDEVAHRPHGDPGGYWDWEYYMALVAWDGADATRKPIRTVLDISSLFGWRPPGGAWTEAGRDSGQPSWRAARRKRGPDHRHGFGERYLWAAGSESAAEDDAVVFKYAVPKGGRWSVAAWWPSIPTNNQSAHFAVETTASDPAQRTASTVVDQRQRGIRTRRTSALPSTPQWYPLSPAPFSLREGDLVTVSITRQTSGQGRVIADAIRLLRTE